MYFKKAEKRQFLVLKEGIVPFWASLSKNFMDKSFKIFLKENVILITTNSLKFSQEFEIPLYLKNVEFDFSTANAV